MPVVMHPTSFKPFFLSVPASQQRLAPVSSSALPCKLTPLSLAFCELSTAWLLHCTGGGGGSVLLAAYACLAWLASEATGLCCCVLLCCLDSICTLRHVLPLFCRSALGAPRGTSPVLHSHTSYTCQVVVSVARSWACMLLPVSTHLGAMQLSTGEGVCPIKLQAHAGLI